MWPRRMTSSLSISKASDTDGRQCTDWWGGKSIWCCKHPLSRITNNYCTGEWQKEKRKKNRSTRLTRKESKPNWRKEEGTIESGKIGKYNRRCKRKDMTRDRSKIKLSVEGRTIGLAGQRKDCEWADKEEGAIDSTPQRWRERLTRTDEQGTTGFSERGKRDRLCMSRRNDGHD